MEEEFKKLIEDTFGATLNDSQQEVMAQYALSHGKRESDIAIANDYTLTESTLAISMQVLSKVMETVPDLTIEDNTGDQHSVKIKDSTTQNDPMVPNDLKINMIELAIINEAANEISKSIKNSKIVTNMLVDRISVVTEQYMAPTYVMHLNYKV